MLHEKLLDFDHLVKTSDSPCSRGGTCTFSNTFNDRSNTSKPKAKRWDRHLSIESRARYNSTLKASTWASPSIITLGTARPVAENYPWDTKGGVDSPVSKSGTNGEDIYDLAQALNYGHAAGSPQLVRFFTEHVTFFHNPPYADWETCLTCGTTSAIEIVFRMLCTRGEWILAEEHTYPGFIEAPKPLDIRIQGVEMDKDGLVPEDLDYKMHQWDCARGPRPAVLYMIPSGQNPTGSTQPTERRKAIYRLAEQHALLIIEDDPYYFLQLGDTVHEATKGAVRTMTPNEYLRTLPPSYLSLDVSGRVIRLDSTSKILAPGLRCGWLTACSQLVAKFLNHTEFSTGSPSGPSQLMLHRLLNEAWGHEGFVRWLMDLSLQYRKRRDIMVKACERSLPSEICRWQVPTTGMFLWIAIDWRRFLASKFQKSKCASSDFALEAEEEIHLKARKLGVQVSKGSWFATGKVRPNKVYIRLTFAAAPEDALHEAVLRFGHALRDVNRSE